MDKEAVVYTHTHTHTHTHIHTLEYSLSIKKEMLPFAVTWMDRDKYCMMESKNVMNEFICKTETDSQTENKLMVSKGEKWGGINYEINIYTLLYIK